MSVIIILLFITVAVWIVLTLFLNAYEKSQPIYSINEYIDTIDSSHVEVICQPLLNELSPLQDTTVLIENMKNSISNATPVKYSRESNNEKTVYYLHDGKTYIEKVTLTPGKKIGFGFKKWAVTNEELLTNQLKSSITINVPETYSVYFGDIKLDDSFITDKKVEYNLLKEFYSEKGINLPYLVSYLTGEIIGDTNIHAIDSNGNNVTYDMLNEDYYSNNCNDTEKSSLSSFIDCYIRAYVTFLSNSNRNTDGNYLNIIQYVQSGSTLESRLRDAKKSNGFNSSLGDEIESIDILHYMNCGNGLYMCDVEFTYITTGQNRQKTELTNNIKLLIQQSSTGTFKAISMAQY